MSFELKWITWITLLSVLVFVSCNQSGVPNKVMENTVSIFKHEASADFYKSGTYLAADLKDYHHDGVLLTVGMGKKGDFTNRTHLLWGYFFTKEPNASVFIESVQFSNGNRTMRRTVNEHILFEEKYRGFEQVKIKGFSQAKFLVFDGIPEDFFLEGIDNFPVKMNVQINSRSISQNFTIVRKQMFIPIR